MAANVPCLFMCLFAIHITSLVKCLQVLAWFFSGLFSYCLSPFLFVLCISSVSDVSCSYHFSYFLIKRQCHRTSETDQQPGFKYGLLYESPCDLGWIIHLTGFLWMLDNFNWCIWSASHIAVSQAFSFPSIHFSECTAWNISLWDAQWKETLSKETWDTLHAVAAFCRVPVNMMFLCHRTCLFSIFQSYLTVGHLACDIYLAYFLWNRLWEICYPK